MFRRIVSKLKNLQQVKVGTDRFGNQYFHATNDTNARSVEYHNANVFDVDQTQLPPLWNSWLRRVRDQPPTEQELLEFEQQQRTLAANVHELELKDRKMQLKEQRLREQNVTNEYEEQADEMLEFEPTRK